MDWGFLLGIIGTVATLVFGVWGIYLTIRRGYPGRMLFIEEDCIGLFDSIVRNLPELSVQFKGAPVKENLVLLKGFLLNVGHKDISNAMVEQRLRANLPEGYRWLTAKVVAASPAVKADVKVASETSLEFDLGLFRCGEFLKFEALAEVPALGEGSPVPAESLKADLAFDHRIADTGSIKTADLPEGDQRGYRNKLIIAAVIALLVVGLSTILAAGGLRNSDTAVQLASVLYPGIFQPTDYTIQKGNQRMEVRVTALLDDRLRVKEIGGDFQATLSTREFNLMKPEVAPTRRNQARLPRGIILLFISLMALLALITGGVQLLTAWNNYRLGKMLAENGGDMAFTSRSQRKSGSK